MFDCFDVFKAVQIWTDASCSKITEIYFNSYFSFLMLTMLRTSRRWGSIVWYYVVYGHKQEHISFKGGFFLGSADIFVISQTYEPFTFPRLKNWNLEVKSCLEINWEALIEPLFQLALFSSLVSARIQLSIPITVNWGQLNLGTVWWGAKTNTFATKKYMPIVSFE